MLICGIGSGRGRLADKGGNLGRGVEMVAGCINVTIHMCSCKVHDRGPEAQFCSETEAIRLRRESLLLPKTTHAQVRL
jgi:hypothetical protein